MIVVESVTVKVRSSVVRCPAGRVIDWFPQLSVRAT